MLPSNDSTNPKDGIGRQKLDLSLVPPASLIHEALAMENGAKKYGPYNWRHTKVRSTVYLAAATRHIVAFLDGENEATDSGVHHLAHAKACCGILLDAIETGNVIDDRPPVGAASRLLQKRGQKPFPAISSVQDDVAKALDKYWPCPYCAVSFVEHTSYKAHLVKEH